MNPLDISRINLFSPYKVWVQEDGINFETEYGLRFAVDFDEDPNPYFIAYWFNLKNKNAEKSPNDKKVAETVVCIIDEFFHQNPEILLYMCSTSGGKQAQRSRLFLRWFNGAKQQEKYAFRSVELPGEDGFKEYIALIVERTNPQLVEILGFFEREISMFNDNK